MRGFSLGLGVRCQYCHTGGDGRSFQGVNFAADDKVEKKKAREMLQMARRINNELLTVLPERRTPAVVVECATCHRGLPVPRTLQRELVNVATENGPDSAVAFYRRAREQHGSDGVYDLTETSVSEAARTLMQRNKSAEAIALLEANVEIFQRSPFTLSQLAATYDAAGNKDKAIEYYKAVLAISPNDAQARRRLTALGAPPPQ
jgi:tetratricopeptide (TPR) repeat protein